MSQPKHILYAMFLDMIHLCEATSMVQLDNGLYGLCCNACTLAKLEETKLTSAAILSRMIADTAGVDKRLSCPTQTRLIPLAAAIFAMIYNMKIISTVIQLKLKCPNRNTITHIEELHRTGNLLF